MSRESWLVIGCRTCQTNKGGRGQLSHSGEKERSCQTPTIVWNSIRAVQETPSAALLWNSITKGTGMFREELLDCDIFVNEKTSSPPPFCVCASVGLRAGHQEFCWQTSQLAVLWWWCCCCCCGLGAPLAALPTSLWAGSASPVFVRWVPTFHEKRFRPKKEKPSKMKAGTSVNSTQS